MQRYGELSIVPTNSKFAVYADRALSTNADLAKGDPMFPAAGRKPWEVGRVLRMSGWLREGTWKIAQPRGMWSHLDR